MVTKYSVVLLLFALAAVAGAAAEKAVVFSSKEEACDPSSDTRVLRKSEVTKL